MNFFGERGTNMTDITVLYPMITECVVNLLKIAMMVIFGMLIIPWVKKSAIPWLRERQLYGLICKFVRAAEKLAESGAISKEAKLDYVLGLLAKNGIEVTPVVRALIESAVGELDDALSNQLINLADAITDAEGLVYVPVDLETGEPVHVMDDAEEDDLK